jgi:hypothetical protein
MLREFEEIEISRQSCRGDCEIARKNSEDFCLDFLQEFGLRTPWTERKRVAIWKSRGGTRTGEGVEGEVSSQIVRYT